MLYGPPGSGKTVFAHNWPRTRTLDLDQGMQSVAWAIREGIIKGKTLDEIVYATITESDRKKGRVQKSTAWDRCTDKLDEWLDASDEWDTLIVDSATALNALAINAALDANATLGLSKSKQDSKTSNLTILRMQDWGSAMSMFTDFIDWLRSSDFEGKTIILIAHEYETTDSAGSLVRYDPLLIGQLRSRITKDFGEVYYCTVEGTRAAPKYIIQTQKDARHNCKSRYGCLPDKMPQDYNEWKKTIEDYWT